MVSQHAKAIRFVSCWVAVYLVIFSLASTKLPNYVLPAYPALAIIIGRYFAMWTQDIDSVSRVWLKTGWILLIAFGGLIALGVPGLGLIPWNGETLLDRVGMDQVLQQRFVWLGVAGIPLLLFGTIGAWLLWSNRPRLSAGAFAVAALSLIMLLSQYVAPELDRFQSAQRLAQRWSTRVGSVDTHVAVFGFFRPTLVFYFARDIHFCDSVDEAIDFAKMGGDSILVTTESQYARLKGQLPDSTRIIERISQFPNRGEVLVLGDKSLMR